MQYTTNYGLNKPDGTDVVKISDLNANADAIDAALTPTADPTQTPTSNGPGKLVQWISWITNRIKGITGKTNWWEAPATTLEAAKAHMDASAPHSGHVLTSDVVTSPVANKILRLNADAKLPASITGDAATVGGVTPSGFAPASHVGTGGSAHAVATTSAAGFMSAADKQKLDTVASGSEPNQNAFASVKAVASDGMTSRGQVDADAKTDLLTLKEGQNISLAVDSTNDVVTIGVNTTGLNADTVDGQHASAFASASHSHANATTSAAGFMSPSDKAKLDGIASGAEVNQNAFSVVQAQDGSGTAIGSVSADSKTDTVNFRAGTGIGLSVSGDVITISSTASQNAFTNVAVSGQSTVAADSPSDTLTLAGTGGVTVTTDASTDTVTIGFAMTDAVHGNRGGGSLHAVATTSSAGFMSASDKAKLDGIQAGAQVNQNAFSNVKVGATTIAADSPTDTLELVAGANISLTPDATNDKVTIAVTGVAQASHTHGGADITSKVSAASSADSVPWTGVTGKPSTFPPSAHTHAGGDITSAVAQATNADTLDGVHASALAEYIATVNNKRASYAVYAP